VRPLEAANSLLRGRAAVQTGSMGAAGESDDLFAGKSITRRSPAAKRRLAPELTAARVLCNQLRRKRASAEKKRIAHLICMNLLAILNRPSQA
jgi:phenylpyruvate tautomerase PptA (4-oxalocrotonate tautomerase family)